MSQRRAHLPTFEPATSFLADFRQLSPSQQAAFRRAVTLFVAGLAQGRLHPRLRVKRCRSKPGWWEMTWAPDGRASFRYGEPLPDRPGPHVVCLRVGTHDIFG